MKSLLRLEFAFPTCVLGLCLAGALMLPVGETDAAALVQYTFDDDLSVTTPLGTGIASASDFGSVTGGTLQPLTHSTGAGIAVDGSTYSSGEPLDNVAASGGPAGRVFDRTWNSGAGDSFQYYYGFDFTVAGGNSLDVESITFDLGFRPGSGNAIKVEYSTISDFSAGVVKVGEGLGYNGAHQDFLGYGAGGTLGVTTMSTNNFSWNRFTNTDNLGLDEALTGTVYVRIWVKGGSGSDSASASNLFGDNFTVNGTISPVPEPSAIVLLSLGALFACRRRRS